MDFVGNSNELNDLYREVIKQVVSNVKDAFSDDYADNEALSQLQSKWELKTKSNTAALQYMISIKKNSNEMPVKVLVRREVP